MKRLFGVISGLCGICQSFIKSGIFLPQGKSCLYSCRVCKADLVRIEYREFQGQDEPIIHYLSLNGNVKDLKFVKI